MGIFKSFKNWITPQKVAWFIFYYVGHILVFVYGWLKQSNDARLAGLNTLKFSVWVSRGAGLCLGIDGLLLTLPVLRNLMRAIRPGLAWFFPIDESIWFHRQIAYSLLFFTILHTTAHYVNFINVERSQVRAETAWAIHYTQPGGFTGHVMLLVMLLMYTTAHRKIREVCFEAFWWTHHLAFLFLLGLYTHATGCFVRGALPGQPVQCIGYESWHWTIWGGILYFIERVWREIRARQPTELVTVLLHPSGTMELRFVKPGMKYKAGQWLFLSVPEVAWGQWHPFTISSAPDDAYISIHIRQVGDFTRALGARLGCTAALASEISDSAGGLTDKEREAFGERRRDTFVDIGSYINQGQGMPKIRIDGPFGAPAEDVFDHEVAILIGTGIGVTPFASILKNIWYMQQKKQLGALRRVIFVWTNRESVNFEWFQTLLKDLENNQTDPDFLQINMYLTMKIDPDMAANIAINDAGSSFDPLTNLRTRTHFGRPNYAQIFQSTRNAIESGRYLAGRESALVTKVGVFFCGNSALGKKIRQDALGAGSEHVKFSFAKEHF